MSKLLFIISIGITILLTIFSTFTSAVDTPKKKTIVITSQTLTADNKNNTATFEGSVVAKTDEITIYSDNMIVFYDNSEGKIKKIYAVGNVKVQKEDRALFSNEAVYLDDEKKIIFTGNPKAIEGENVITGKQITLFLEDDRAVVEGSKVILQNKIKD
jgi:lipopolysaccharide export system protein LptA